LNDELGRILKEVAMAYLGICLEGLRVASVLPETQTEYHNENPFSKRFES
jgi:hypothetical protein